MPNKFAKVLVPQKIDFPLTYGVPKGMEVAPGSFVKIPFRNKAQWGVVWEMESKAEIDPKKIKDIIEVASLPPLSQTNRQFMQWVAQYTMTSLGLVAKMGLGTPDAFEKIQDPKAPDYKYNLATLNGAQDAAAKDLCNAVKAKNFSPIVLEGVTGSGKTEVYFKAIQECLQQGQQAMILLPEISLSTQWLDRFQARFGAAPLVWHSDITKAQKRKAWQTIIQGQPTVVVGARSALFLPFPNLLLIVVDEEHDGSFKQESQVIYNARDMAVKRGSLAPCPVVLSSATPSVETLYNVTAGKYSLVHLPSRHGKAQIPTVDLIDMRAEEIEAGRAWLSPTLLKEIQATIDKGDQVLLFMNRRGYAPLVLCKACGHRLQCPSCSSWLVYHKHTGRIQCHHCDYNMKIPSKCESCEESGSLILYGPGVERIAEEISQHFPDCPYEIVSSDLLTTPKKVKEAFDRIESGETKLVIGTQIMAKGHHFPNLTLVGVVDADLGLISGDLRAAERTYQLLHQVSGRAGRGEKQGKVLLQTYNPDNELMEILKTQDYKAFIDVELSHRQAAGFPPFGTLASLIISARQAPEGEAFCRSLAQTMPPHASISVLGPAPAPMHLLKGWYRWRFLIKASKTAKLQPFIHDWLSKMRVSHAIKVQVDIDPYSFV